MNIYIGSEKGGSGKTTITTLLYLYLNRYYEVDINLIDTDTTQLSLYELMEDRKKNGIKPFTNVLTEKNDIIKIMKKEECINLIDGRANFDNDDINDYIYNSDLFLLVSNTNRFDILNTKKLIEILEENGINYKVLLNKVKNDDEFIDIKNELNTKKVINGYLKDREDYRNFDKNGNLMLDNSLLNLYKYKVKKELRIIVEDILEVENE